MPIRATDNPRIRSRGFSILAAATAVTVLVALGGALPAYAGYNEGDPCKPGDHVMLIGGGTGDLQRTVVMDCSPEKTWATTATYISEKEVIIEKRGIDFDFAGYSNLNPFLKNLSIAQAAERFPDPKGAVWDHLRRFVLDALSPKVQAVASRRAITIADICIAYPVQSTDDQIRTDPSRHFLPPAPKPDGKTGTITFSLDPALTAEQRSTVLDALAQYDAAQPGTKLPRIEPAAAGSTDKPTIVFKNDSSHLTGSPHAAEARLEFPDTGRAGLQRWKSGSIALGEGEDLGEDIVMHEILHVLGFVHVPAVYNADGVSHLTMGAQASGRIGIQRAGDAFWGLDDGYEDRLDTAIDPCTKKGMDMADPRY